MPNRSAKFPLPSCIAFVTALLLLSVAAPGQTLARPGWTGSGMKIEPWWTHAVLYTIDPHGFKDSNGDGTGDLRGLTGQLDYIRSLGVEGIVMTHFAPEQGDAAARLETVDPVLGTLDDFDDLLREAARDNLRVIVEFAPQQAADPAALAAATRFWLSRGVGGVSVRAENATAQQAAPQQMSSQQLSPLRTIVKGFPRQRVLIAEAASGDAANAPARQGEGADLIVDPALARVEQFTAAAIRPALLRLQSAATADGITPLALTDSYGLPRSATRFGDGTNDVAIAKVLGTILLATRANVQLYFGQEIGMAAKPGAPALMSLMSWGLAPDPAAKKPKPPQGPEVAAEEADPDSVLSFYRRLIDLHHANATLHSGAIQFMNHDDQNSLVWISRRQTVSPREPAIVVACNLSSKPVTISLADDLASLHLRGVFLRPVLRSDNGMGGMSLNAVKLAPYSVYIGELRF